MYNQKHDVHQENKIQEERMNTNVKITIEEFERIWHMVGDMSRVSSNGYRILVELCLYGESTQKQLCDKRNWLQSSVSMAMTKLYENNLVKCKAENRKMVYYVNPDLKLGKGEDKDIKIDMPTFCALWNCVSDISAMSANCFRVYIDICLYGNTTQKELWERRNWKISGVSKTFHKLYDLGVLNCEEKNGRKIYSAKIDIEKMEV